MIKGICRFCRVTITNAPIYFFINIIFMGIMAIGIILMSFSNKLLVDAIISAKNLTEFNIKVIIPALIYFLAITVAGNFVNFQDMMVAIYTKESRKVFNKLFLFKSYKSPQDRFYDNNFYNNYEFVKTNIDSTSDITVEIFNKLLLSLFNVILAISAIAIFDMYILVCILILSIGLIFINKYVVKRKVRLNKEYVQFERKSEYFSELLSSRKHSKELRIFKTKEKFLKKWEESYRLYTKAKFKFEIKVEILNSIMGAIKLIMNKGLTIYFLYLVFIGKIGAGDSVFLISLVGSLNYRINDVINIITNSMNEKYKYAENFEEFTGKVNKKNLNSVDENRIRDKVLKVSKFEKLELKNISYKYPHGEKNALNNINFTLNKGEVVSILGYNGSGKSTLSKIICGILEDYEGEVILNNKPIDVFEKEEYYKYFGVAFQEFSRYSISLKENIALGMIEESNDEEKIRVAMDKGNIKDIIKKLPKGGNTILGKEYDEKGQDLSGGQWQRIALARAYMGDPEVLILDEPTAAIDPIEEMRMLNRFRDIISGKTAILISHRIGFARLSDRICIMEKGRIVEDGTHDELIALKGKYYELFTSQKQLYEEVS